MVTKITARPMSDLNLKIMQPTCAFAWMEKHPEMFWVICQF